MMSMTPDQSRKVGLGISVTPAPFLTPKPERRRPDSRPSDLYRQQDHRDKEVNIQVLIRCRPLSDEEQRLNVQKVVSCNEQKREVTVLQNLANKQVDRVFTFDKVFGPKAQQRSIYDQAISPIVKEVLDGYNCTVFAYGQTGTGKTYTMEGGMRNKGGDLPAEAGVIPRAVRQIFDVLEAQNADYSMRVTFLELYNEEITDLLAAEDSSRSTDDRQKKPIMLMEDGKGSVIVRGLEEESVYSATDIYTLLERGSARRRTADTLLNKRSSRSHSVFTITVYIKEAAVGDEELIKCGKLNLVDLAGSENISRTGAREGRAREAGEINKSLLTLGRVINALAEHSSHIPYRDSKLTRLLRDSLGGRTKTCIIATISPSTQCVEETLSTLDYAYRAKNIKNKPEANQKMSKSVLLKDLYLEIERMKEEVRAAREKNGVYIPHERFTQEEAEKKARNQKIEELENDLILSEKQVHRFRELYHAEGEQKLDLESELQDCKMNLEKSNKEILDLQEKYKAANSALKEKELFISKLLLSENSLIERAKGLSTDLHNASEDIDSLFTKLDQKDRMEAKNYSSLLRFGSHLDQSLKELHKIILGVVSQQEQQLKYMEEHMSSFLARKCDATKVMESKVQKMTETYNSGIGLLKEIAQTGQKKASSDLEQINSTVLVQTNAVDKYLATMVSEAKNVISDAQSSLSEQQELLAFSAQLQQEGLQRTLASVQVISKATVDFFDDLQRRASRVMATLEENQIEKIHQLANFEKTFKEEAAREEKEALKQIALVLSTLTSKKTALVSEASRDIRNSSIEETRKLKHEMSEMRQISGTAKKDLKKNIEKVESNFMEDTFSAAEYRAVMESGIKQCSASVDNSQQLWENAQSFVKALNNGNMKQMEATVKANICSNNTIHKEFSSKSASISSDLDARASDVMGALDESLAVDRNSKNEIDATNSSCMDQLRLIQDDHGTKLSHVRSQAENFLTKEYLVDEHTSPTPKKRVIQVTSLTSIEEMRTPVPEDFKGDKATGNRQKWDSSESRIPRLSTSPIRAPFVDVN